MKCNNKNLIFFPVCGLLNVGVAAIFGPQSTHTASHVQSICDNMEVRKFTKKYLYHKYI